IVVSNTAAGTHEVDGANVVDNFLGTYFSSDTYTVAAQTAGAGATAGSGNLSQFVTLTSGASITYSVTGTVSAAATDFVIDTASVSVPQGYTDTNTSNNVANDVIGLPAAINSLNVVSGSL